MRAVIAKDFGSLDKLTLEEVRDPTPGVGEILVDVCAVGVNFSDLLVIDGKYQNLPTPPFVPGKVVSGVVAELGCGCARFEPGDRVMALLDDGAYAERAVANQGTAFTIPDGMSHVQAASMGTAYQTAHFALIERGQYRAGETVLINGATGGVGLAALQLAKFKEATVLAGLTSPEKAATARANGADYVIDLSGENLADSLRRQVRDLTEGRGVDIVLDPIGGEVFEASLRALAWRGRAVIIGFASGRIPTIKANYLLLKNISVNGLYRSSYWQRDPEWVRRVQDEIFALFAARRINPPIMRTFALEDFRDALSLITERKVLGRVVLTTGRGA